MKTYEKVDEIKEDAQKNPRITLWSVKSAACFRYLKKTVPEFSISRFFYSDFNELYKFI